MYQPTKAMDLTAAEAESDEEDRHRSRAAMLALFLPLSVALLAAVAFVTAFIGPRVMALQAQFPRDAKISRTAPQAAANAAEALSGTYDSTDEGSADAPETRGSQSAATVRQSRVFVPSATASEKTAAPKPARAQAPKPLASDPGQGVDVPPPTAPTEPQAPEVPEPVEPSPEPGGHGAGWWNWMK